ncbi:hypothetical protein [Streptomyces sp. DH10]|uniref:hypothetical protein n=1 Tax=Streptomyces sp. DH10 TaxID=3040121 RepID=UPI0024427F8D|nr:hypothetical protein [Streptomyces sp. DH10]MDG9709737.1 hypothetical protein [Streptomyces sp. DH10]
MTQLVRHIRSNEDTSGRVWPLRTQEVSYIGSACVVESAGDFDTQDLALVRHQFPDRHVTLDGDVITVWPAASHGRL